MSSLSVIDIKTGVAFGIGSGFGDYDLGLIVRGIAKHGRINKEDKMKVYLASKFALKDWVIYVSNYLVNTGHEITCKWWYDDIKGLQVTDTEWYKHPQVIEVSDRDYKGVDDADALILISDLSAPLSFNGANVELGYAVARNKRIFILGKVDRNALYSKGIFCKDLFELIDALNEYRPK